MSNPVNEQLIQPLTKFAKDSVMLIRACTKPDAKEFKKIATATIIGHVSAHLQTAPQTRVGWRWP